MAKEQVLCPFSKKLCAECALYRGRHYYLCYCQNYRGYLGEKGKRKQTGKAANIGNFDIPALRLKAMDPFLNNQEDEKKEI